MGFLRERVRKREGSGSSPGNFNIRGLGGGGGAREVEGQSLGSLNDGAMMGQWSWVSEGAVGGEEVEVMDGEEKREEVSKGGQAQGRCL